MLTENCETFILKMSIFLPRKGFSSRFRNWNYRRPLQLQITIIIHYMIPEQTQNTSEGNFEHTAVTVEPSLVEILKESFTEIMLEFLIHLKQEITSRYEAIAIVHHRAQQVTSNQISNHTMLWMTCLKPESMLSDSYSSTPPMRFTVEKWDHAFAWLRGVIWQERSIFLGVEQ